MKVAIYNNQEQKTLNVKKKLLDLLKPTKIEIDQKNPDLVISIGGDGTLLGAFHAYQDLVDQVWFIGIHTGHLGFYTDWKVDELDTLVYSLIYKKPDVVDCPLLDVQIQYKNNDCAHLLALNEATIRKNNGSTEEADVFINDKFFEKFRGDGLCFSTPTGSTAYNKSIHGAIIEPGINAFQMTEIASLNNIAYRTLSAPIVLPATKKINIELKECKNTYLTVDQLAIEQPIGHLQFSLSKHCIKFAHYRPQEDFWDVVKRSFIGPQTL